MILDASYFENGELKIPNAVDGNAATTAIEGDLDSIIKRYERLVLLGALGTELYGLLETATEDLPGSDQKWQDLVNGTSYSVDGIPYVWDGLKGKNKDGVLANFVYCMYLRHDEIEYSTNGMAVGSVKNAKRASYAVKYVRVWNRFIGMYQDVDTNPRSLYQFLCDRPGDFPIEGFKMYTNINRFGF